MITKKMLKKIESLNECSIFEDFPFDLQNDVDNGDISPNSVVFDELDFIEKLNNKFDTDFKELYDIQDEETNEIYDFLVKYANEKNYKLSKGAEDLIDEGFEVYSTISPFDSSEVIDYSPYLKKIDNKK